MKISLELNQRSIQKAIQQLQDYKKDLLKKNEKFVRRLAELGVEIAKDEVTTLDAIYSGELLNSLNLRKGDVIFNGSRFYVYTDCEWAKYVEFGTGSKGEAQPAEHIPDGISWGYNTGGEKGAQFTTKDGRVGWYYFDKKAGQYFFTEGMPSRPFMYNTATRLRQEVARIAKEVFG